MTMAAAGFSIRRAYGNPNGWPIGLQLYSVSDSLRDNFEGTMKAVAEIGYQQIECSLSDNTLSTAGRSLKQIADLAKSLGLGMRSTIVGVDTVRTKSEIIFNKALDNGIDYIVCGGAWPRDPSRIKPLASADPFVKQFGKYASYANVVFNMTLDDFKWIADVLNETACKAQKLGLTLAYHNEFFEFKMREGVIPYDLLLERTDPELVYFELDCGNMASAGFNPAAYLTRHPKRYRLMHVKDLARDQSEGGLFRAAELGAGTLDWKSIFKAAKRSSVIEYFVEQGPVLGKNGPRYERPGLESSKINYTYLQKLS